MLRNQLVNPIPEAHVLVNLAFIFVDNLLHLGWELLVGAQIDRDIDNSLLYWHILIMSCMLPVSSVQEGQLSFRRLFHLNYLREGWLEHRMLYEKLSAWFWEDLAHLLLQLMHKALLHLAIDLLPSLLERLRRAHTHRLLLVRQKGYLSVGIRVNSLPLLLLLNLSKVYIRDFSCVRVAPHLFQIFYLQLMAMVKFIQTTLLKRKHLEEDWLHYFDQICHYKSSLS